MRLVRETGLSALIATHNMKLAARMDRVVRLEAGTDRLRCTKGLNLRQSARFLEYIESAFQVFYPSAVPTRSLV